MSSEADGGALSLRPATLEDFDFSYHVKKQALGPYIEETWDWVEAEQQAFHRREFSIENAKVIQWENADAGWLVCRTTSEAVDLHQIYLLPEYQGKGIGSRLIQEVIRNAEAQSLSVDLQVLKCNHRAKALYDRLGFKTVGSTATHDHMRRK